MPQADRLCGFFSMVNFFEYLTQAQELFDTAVRLRAEANDNGLAFVRRGLQLSREFAERAMLASRLGDHERAMQEAGEAKRASQVVQRSVPKLLVPAGNLPRSDS